MKIKRARLIQVAAELANHMENFIGDEYPRFFDEILMPENVRKEVKKRLRWTIVDENTGENLLETK